MFALAPSLNNDATIYLFAADTFNESGWSAAQSIYPRAFYPALIGSFSQSLGIETLTAAQIINSLLVAFTAFAFVHLVAVMGGDRVTQLVAAAVIVIYPTLCEYKDYIIRDFGYWGFSLFMLAAFIRYQRDNKIQPLLGFLASAVMATQFRHEAAPIALLLPLSLLFHFQASRHQRMHQLLICYGLLLALGLLAFATGTAAGFDIYGAFYKLVLEFPSQVTAQLAEEWISATEGLRQAVLNKHAEEYAGIGVALTYGSIFTGDLLRGLTAPVLIAAAYLIVKGAWRWPCNSAYWTLSAILFVGLLLFIVFMQFLQTRYILLSCLLLLIPLCFSVAAFIQDKNTTRKQRQFLILMALLGSLDAYVSFGHSKSYIPDSILWLKQNTPASARVLSNNPQISYRSGRPYNFHQIEKISLRSEGFSTEKLPKNYDYIAWQFDKREQVPSEFTVHNTRYQRVQTFRSPRGDNVSIYQAM